MQAIKNWYQRWRARAAVEKAARTIRRAAGRFNRARAEANNYSEWMCPACGKVSRGIDHPYRFMSGLKFPACCGRYCWHGWRTFNDYVPERDYPMQPMSEFDP